MHADEALMHAGALDNSSSEPSKRGLTVPITVPLDPHSILWECGGPESPRKLEQGWAENSVSNSFLPCLCSTPLIV